MASQPRSVWRALRMTPGRAALVASLLIAASAVVAKGHDTPGKMVPSAAAAPLRINGFAGCYRIANDSLRHLSGLPQRFALQIAESDRGVAQRVVRAVAADGGVDSVLTGSAWWEISPQAVDVSLAGANRPQTLRLQLTTAESVAVDARTRGGVRMVGIAPFPCGHKM